MTTRRQAKTLDPIKRPTKRIRTRRDVKECTEETVRIALQVCSLFGAEVSELCKTLDITQAVYDRWYREHPQFRKAVIKGRDIFDSGEVEESLRKRALGYDYTETRIEDITLKQGTGKDAISVPATKITRIKKHVQGDVTAQIFWLKNRNPERWKDVREQAVKGEIKQIHEGKVNLTDGLDDIERVAQVLQVLSDSGGLEQILNAGAVQGVSSATH